ncbi:MAG: type IV pilus modification PilV family protein [bacterium]
MKRNRRNGGFTLLEVMVAVAILAVGMVSLFQLFSGSLRSAKVSEDYTKAVIGAQKKMDEVLGYLYLEDYEQLEHQGEFGSGEEEDLLEGYRWEIVDEDYIVQELEDAWAENPKNYTKGDQKDFLLKKIMVRVLWPSGTGDKSLELVTLKMFYKKDEQT